MFRKFNWDTRGCQCGGSASPRAISLTESQVCAQNAQTWGASAGVHISSGHQTKGATLTNMSIRPEDLPFHLSQIDTSAGGWLIAVDSASKTQGSNVILLKLTLEQSIDLEHFRTRELGMTVFASDLNSPTQFGDVLTRIRHWIETTEGDGFLDLTHRIDSA